MRASRSRHPGHWGASMLPYYKINGRAAAPVFSDERLRIMFGLQDIRKSKVWQEAYQKGYQEGLEIARRRIEEGTARARRDYAKKFLAKGMSVTVISELLEIPARKLGGKRRRSPIEAHSDMLSLQIARKSKVPDKVPDPGDEKCIALGQARVTIKLVKKFCAKGKLTKEIAILMDLPAKEVRRLAKLSAV
jgi:hypothetical protein